MNHRESRQHCLMVNVDNDTVVMGALEVPVDPMVKLRRSCERDSPEPQKQHQNGTGKSAVFTSLP